MEKEGLLKPSYGKAHYIYILKTYSFIIFRSYVALSDPDYMKFQQWLGPFLVDWRIIMHANGLLTIFQE